MSLIPIYATHALVSHGTARHPVRKSLLSFSPIPGSTTVVPGETPGADTTVSVLPSPPAPFALVSVTPSAVVIDPLDVLAVCGRSSTLSPSEVVMFFTNNAPGFSLVNDKIGCSWQPPAPAAAPTESLCHAGG